VAGPGELACERETHVARADDRDFHVRLHSSWSMSRLENALSMASLQQLPMGK
jgi:hypothetical protein